MLLKHAKDVTDPMSCRHVPGRGLRLSLLALALGTCLPASADEPAASTVITASGEQAATGHGTTITLSNGSVLTLDGPREPAGVVRAGSEADNLIDRLRDGFAMTPVDNARIGQHKLWLQGKQAYLDRVLDRASRFMYLAVTEAERRGLPTELALLPIIESAYDPQATSRSQAAGLWQFIPDTGRLYGLRQSWWYDGRRDPMESTRAAYDYLSSLYATFGDWSLVLASYNAGPGAVSRAMKRNAAAGLPTDYWSLRLPEETMNYVPRFMAVVALFRDPSRFGVNLATLPNRPVFRTVTARGPLSLNDVADVTGIDLPTLRLLNPGLRRDGMDPDGPAHVHVPASLDVTRENQLAQLGNSSSAVRVAQNDGTVQMLSAPAPAQVLPVAVRQTVGGGRHLVQAKETWYSIARAYNTTPAQLSAANQSALSTPLDIGRELVIPAGAGIITSPAAPEVITVASSQNDGRVEIRRRVVAGDTLDTLRRQYQVTLAELRAWNGDLQELRPGQILVLRVVPDMLSPRAL